MKGLLYVVYNEWIKNPETGRMPYKIGITTKNVDERYYGLGLKMPGEFETLFAYKFDNCAKAEHLIQGVYESYCVNGEWFEITDELSLPPSSTQS
ncbi:MAG: GIY-YIG nuclease family protein [Treponema sp.]|nr:GIY-YIG nuclease family protein [Treponema sp.]